MNIKYLPLINTTNRRVSLIEKNKFEDKLDLVRSSYKNHSHFFLSNWNNEGFFSSSDKSVYLKILKFFSIFNFGVHKIFNKAKIGSIGNVAIFPISSQYNYRWISRSVKYLAKKIIVKNFDTEIKNILADDAYEIDQILFHNTSSKNSNINFKYSSEDDIKADHINFYHVDTTPPSVIKVMIYLSTIVDENNGAFRYIPYSYKKNTSYDDWCIRHVVRNNYFNTDKETMRKFYSLPKKYQKRNTFTYLLDDTNYKKQIDKSAIVFKTPCNIILFNPMGIHSGGFIYKGQRKALQITIKGKSIKQKHDK
tara:strand:+ start:286 stop:1209 length:924 start_codon:yes stop_codon:yes gene_type:complete